MPIDRDIQSLVRRESAKIKPTISADVLFTSPEFKQHMENLVRTVTGIMRGKVSLHLIHGDPNGFTACTSGKEIQQNTNHELVSRFDSLYNRYMANVGLTMHECAHILFNDFDADVVYGNLIKSGSLPGDKPALSEEEEENYDELLLAVQDEKYRELLDQVFFEISNVVADPHDEGKLIDRFGGFVANAIYILRDSLHDTIPSLESMMKSDNLSKLAVAYNVMLQYVRFFEVYCEDENTALKFEPMQKLVDMAPALESSLYTDDPDEKATGIVHCMVFLWPYIKEEIEKLEQESNSQQQQQGGGSGGQSQSQGQQSQGQGNQQNSGGSQGQSSSGNSNSQNQSKQGVPNPSQQTIEKIKEQLSKAAGQSGGTQAPTNGKSSNIAKKASASARKGNGSAPSHAPNASAEKDPNAGGDSLDVLLNAIANGMAEEQVQQDITSAGCVEIQTVDLNSTHKGKSVQIETQTDVTQKDIDLYNKMMADLNGYSRRLQAQMRNALRDLSEGSVQHHRMIGNAFEVKSAYRPDQRYFSKVRQPNDMPEMAISILVDHSGSMAGQRLNASMKAAMLLYDFATSLNIPVAVAGHNTTYGGIRYYTYTDYRKVNDAEKYRLAKMVCGSCNRDGMAIQISADRLAKRPEAIKLLLVISDGQPNDMDYGGDSAARDIQSIVRKYKKLGVETIAAAIGSDKDKIKKIYGSGSYLDIEDLDKFPKTLVSLVRKKLI